jgi:drug/metabolite transporter (DMT)-like permease
VLGVAVCPGELDKACRKGACRNSIGLDTCCRFGVQCCLINVMSNEVRLANFEPEASRGGIDLDVKLQAPGARADAKGLARGSVLGEWHGTGWHLEAVVVPFEGAVADAERADQRVFLAGGQQTDIAPANFRLSSWSDRRSGRPSEHLAAEADTKQWQVALKPLAEQLELRWNPRMPVIFVGHRDATHQDDGVVLRQVVRRIVQPGTPEIDLSGLEQGLAKGPEEVGVVMLDLERAHGASVEVCCVRRSSGGIAYARRVAERKRSVFDLALVLTLTTVALWALNIPIVKLAVVAWNPMAFSFVRFAAGAVIYLIIVLVREGSLRVQRRDIPLFLIGGTVGIALNQYSFMYAVEQTTASTVTLLFATTPLWAALLARLLGWEFVKPWFWGAIGICTLGVLLVLIGSGATLSFGSLLGDVFALGAAATWGAYSVLVRPLLQRYSATHVSAIMMLVGTPMIAILGVPQLLDQDFSNVAPEDWFGLGYALVASLIVANLLWFIAIHKAGTARAVALMPLQPFLGVIFSALLLGERLDWKQLAGGIIIIVGIIIAVRSVHPAEPALEPHSAGQLE